MLMPWALRVSGTYSQSLVTFTLQLHPPPPHTHTPLSLLSSLSPSVRDDNNSLMCPHVPQEMNHPAPGTWLESKKSLTHVLLMCMCVGYPCTPRAHRVLLCVSRLPSTDTSVDDSAHS